MQLSVAAPKFCTLFDAAPRQPIALWYQVISNFKLVANLYWYRISSIRYCNSALVQGIEFREKLRWRCVIFAFSAFDSN